MNPPKIYFIDANLVMYSIGSPHPLRDPSKRVFGKIREKKVFVLTNTEVLQEILYRYSSIGKINMGEIAYKSMIKICTTILPVTLRDTDIALELLKSYEGITSRDAIHVATMINNDIKEIISTDSHFDIIPEITRIDPKNF